MQDPIRRGPSAAFLLTLFCFILPFISLSCPGGKFTFTGLQLATGTSIQEPQMFGEPKAKKIDAEPLATFALLVAVAGLIAALAPGRPAQVASALFGGAGAVLMLLLKSRLDSKTLAEGQGMLQVTYEIGFWLASLFFCAAAVLAVMLLRSSPQAAPAPAAGSMPGPDGAQREPLP